MTSCRTQLNEKFLSTCTFCVENKPDDFYKWVQENDLVQL